MEKKQAPCNRKTAKVTNTSGWMYDLPMTEKQKQEMEQATERMRQRYIAAGMRTSLYTDLRDTKLTDFTDCTD